MTSRRLEQLAELAERVGKHARSDGETATAIERLFLSRITSATQPLHVAQWPCFALVAQGSKSITLGGQVLDYGVGDCLIVSLDLPVISQVTRASRAKPNLGIGIAIDRERLANVIARIDLVALPAPESRLGAAVEPASPELLDAVLRYLRLLDHPRDLRGLAPLIEEEILYRLVVGPCGARLLDVARADAPGGSIAKVTRWLRHHLTADTSIAELAGRAGMSVSSLHHHFKAITGLSPVQYLKQLRLGEARRLLLVEQLDVASAGDRVGYRSPSQFSREYARMFGQPPRRDIAQHLTRSAP